MGRAKLFDREETIERRVRLVPGVDAVGRTTAGVGTLDEFSGDVQVPGQPRPVSLGQYGVDPGLKEAMGLELVAGRWFDENRPLDDSTQPYPPDPAIEQALVQRGTNVVINERAAQRLGFRHAADAVGKSVGVALVRLQAGLVPATIVGVVKDARLRSVRDPIEADMFHSTHINHSHMIVRFHGDPAAVRAGVEKVWKAVASDIPFDAHFSEDILLDLYRAEDAQTEIFAAFAILAVTIACLGLFGLAAFTAERRTKEIGIRKVLGARTRDIVRLLVWQFSKPVILANLIAWPIAWWAMRDWLNRFDARIALGPGPFLLAAFVAFVIAVATVGGHAIRIARSNPANALRYE
jgi:putative ABC transport system permease protein